MRSLDVSALVLCLAVAGASLGCESSGSYGYEPVARCVPEGSCDDAMFRAGVAAARGDVSRGRALFDAQCTECHSVTGLGLKQAKAIDMRSPAWQARLDDAEIARTIRAGRPPTMPAFKLDEQALSDVLSFIRTLEQRPPATKASY